MTNTAIQHLRNAAAVAMLALLAACGGNQSDGSQPAADTFYAGQQTARSAKPQAATAGQGTQYRSTGDPSLLEVKLPGGTVNQTLRYKAITIYYNKRLRIPNCVAYELTNTQVAMADAPDAERRSNYNFNRDPKADGCPDWWEYKDTGYDRGHMAPAMDMRWDRTAMAECFLMTNMCPQRHELNDGEWRHMEEAIHTWAKRTERLVIFTGPVMAGGQTKRMGKHRDIAVPDRFFKVVYDPKLKRAVAFVFNNEKARSSWTNYAVDIDEVERLTGIDFLAALPDDLEEAVESKQNINSWPRYTPRR